jgi:hypothetical protein
MSVSMSDKPFDAEACDIGGQASPTNGLSDAKNGLTDMKNAPCNRPLEKNPGSSMAGMRFAQYVGFSMSACLSQDGTLNVLKIN